MLHSEIEELLREVMAASKAFRVGIETSAPKASAYIHSAALGQEAHLVAEFEHIESPHDEQSRQELIERSSRAMRACLRRNGETDFPYLALPNDKPDPKHLILARIQQFLCGIVDTTKLYQMVVLHRGELIASAYVLDELDVERLALLDRQLELAAKKTPGTDHGELIRDDIYARTFWYGASMIGFANSPYALDFVRHRSKMVARELSHLLSLLEDGPESPSSIAPLPE